MPKVLENKLQKEYGKGSDVPYKIMNKMGVMKGNKETPKGVAMEKKLSDESRTARTRGMLDRSAEKMLFGTKRST